MDKFLWLTIAVLIFTGCESVAEDSLAKKVAIESLLDRDIRVILNPNGITPLSAQLFLHTKRQTKISVMVLGEQPISHKFKNRAHKHSIPVLGLYPGKENKVLIRIDDQEAPVFATKTLTINTEKLPNFFPTVEVQVADKFRMEKGWTLSNLSIGDNGRFRTLPFIFDTNGDVRWFMDLTNLGGMTFAVDRFFNGNLRVGRGNTIYEYDMLGSEIRRWEMNGFWYHHDTKEMPNGNILVAVNRQDVPTIEDHVIELDRSTGDVVRKWDLRQLFDSKRMKNSKNSRDWFHMNALWYSSTDDALILSGRNQNAVVKVSGDNRLIWILVPHFGWDTQTLDEAGTEIEKFLLTAIDEEGIPFPKSIQNGHEDTAGFSWSWGQHASKLLPNGNLLVFDNGLNRNFSSNSVPFSRGVEYKINSEKMTVQQIWQYGRQRGEEFYSAIVSSVDYLTKTKNRLIMPGIVWGEEPYALISEVTYPDNDLVFEAKIKFKNKLGTLVRTWGQFDLIYRSERLQLYPIIESTQRNR